MGKAGRRKREDERWTFPSGVMLEMLTHHFLVHYLDSRLFTNLHVLSSSSVAKLRQL